MSEYVVLVDEHDNPIGVEEKMLAHQKGLLHRAFSIYIVSVKNGVRRLLLQQRAAHKYHCGGLWTNTCCSHPRPDETIIAAATRRLVEEMGLTTPLTEVGIFTYRAEFENGLCEHEVDHVLIGYVEPDIEIMPNSDEVMAHRWEDWDSISAQVKKGPTAYTPWFLQGMDCVTAACSRGLLW